VRRTPVALAELGLGDPGEMPVCPAGWKPVGWSAGTRTDAASAAAQPASSRFCIEDTDFNRWFLCRKRLWAGGALPSWGSAIHGEAPGRSASPAPLTRRAQQPHNRLPAGFA